MSLDGTLTFISVLLIVLLPLVFIVGLSIELRLGRLIRIGRAMLEEQRKGNKMLQYLNDREYERAKSESVTQRREGAKREPDPPSREATAGQEVYRID